MSDAILTVNVGSSSLKYGLFAYGPEGKKLTSGNAPFDLKAPDFSPVMTLLRDHKDLRVRAVSHRVVHGGIHYSAPVIITDDVIRDLDRLIPLAPLHLPPELAGIQALGDSLADATHVACFDTAFHATQDPLARRFALPERFYQEGVRRYGFHGLSYASIARRLPGLGLETARVIVAHLGSGASACAISNCKSVATTMGFTALDGLMMGTRSGSVDPGVLIYLMREHNMDADAIDRLLSKESGLKGVSGLSNDMRVLTESDDPHAKLAVDLFCYRAAGEMAGLIPALGGLDSIIFTAGIGENSDTVRKTIADYLHWANPVIHTVETDEESMLALHAFDILEDA